MNLTAAEISAIFRACCLSDQMAARLLNVTDGTVRRWRRGDLTPRRTHAKNILAIEATVRQMVEAAIEQIEAAGPEQIVLVGYREVMEMLPYTNPPVIEMQFATLAALRLRYGRRLRIIEFDGVDYAAWLGDREDTQARRAAWAVEYCRPVG